MKGKIIIGLLILSLVAVPLFAVACEEEEPPPAQQEEEEEGPPAEEEEEEEEGNWWDDWGEPQYGGEITIRNMFINPGSFDPALGFMSAGTMAGSGWLEGLTFYDPTLDRDIWAYNVAFTSEEYLRGLLAESWEQTDAQTVIVHLRHGVYWHDKPPVNGREFTAEDVQFNFDRILGVGEFTEAGPNPMSAGSYSAVERAIATDRYTVQFELKQPGAAGLYQILSAMPYFVPPEWVQQADPTDWQSVVGTGPWILTDFVAGTSMTLSKNPNYWGYDERFPENQLPYADTITHLAIPDMSTALAALRSGQVDMMTDPMGALPWQQAGSLAETNPEIQQAWMPGPGGAVLLRCDTKPFTDIRVRKALNLAIDRELIAENYYGGAIEGKPVGLIGPALTGWVTPYDEWPAELQAEYSYNPTLAMEFLAEAAADGVFEPNDLGGFDTNCVVSSTQDPQLLEVIQGYFRDIGVDMEIRVMDPAALQGLVSGGLHDQMYFTDAQSGLVASIFLTLSYRHSASIPQTNPTFNYDANYDALVNQFEAAVDSAEMKRLAAAADIYALQRHWTVYLCAKAWPVVWQPWIKGYSGEILFDNAWSGACRARLWIDQALR